MIIAARRKFTIEEYHQLLDLGFFTENDRIKLIRADTQGKFAYRTKSIMLPHETIAIPGFRDIYLDLSTIFPKS